MIQFRGREQSRPVMGVRLLQRFAEEVSEYGTVESNPMIDGRNMVMIIGPFRNKSDVKADASAKRNAAREASRAAKHGQPSTGEAANEPADEAATESVPESATTEEN